MKMSLDMETREEIIAWTDRELLYYEHWPEPMEIYVRIMKAGDTCIVQTR